MLIEAMSRTCKQTIAGILTAAATLVPLTLLFINVDVGLHRSSKILFYLLIVAVTAGVGGIYAAAAAALVATVIVDYFFTHPLYVIDPFAPDMLVFIGATIATAALAVLAARSATHTAATGVDVTAAVNEALHTAADARSWAAVYATTDGEYAIHAPDQSDREAAQQLADGVHGLTCPGCDRCRLEVA